MTVSVSFLACIVCAVLGALAYALTTHAKAAELGRIIFFSGFFVGLVILTGAWS